MNKAYHNLCVRCGRERIETKAWDERMEGGSLVRVTENSCPDVDCQQKVDRDNKKIRDKQIALMAKRKHKVN